MKLSTAIILSMMISLPLMAQQGNGRGNGNRQGNPQMHQRMQERLGLTTEQVAKLDVLKEKHQEELKTNQEARQELQMQLTLELKKENPSKKVIENLAKQIGELHEKMILMRAEHLQEMRPILTNEQYQQILDMRKNHKGEMGKGGRHHGQGNSGKHGMQ